MTVNTADLKALDARNAEAQAVHADTLALIPDMIKAEALALYMDVTDQDFDMIEAIEYVATAMGLKALLRTGDPEVAAAVHKVISTFLMIEISSVVIEVAQGIAAEAV